MRLRRDCQLVVGVLFFSTIASAPPVSRAAHLDAQARQMLAAHNQVRREVHVPPLRWSPKLSAYAREWASHLLTSNAFTHRPKLIYGENIYDATGGKSAPREVVASWASERKDYDVKTDACRGQQCGHYKQLVWRLTRFVGCAEARNQTRDVWVCNYEPHGNTEGESPY